MPRLRFALTPVEALSDGTGFASFTKEGRQGVLLFTAEGDAGRFKEAHPDELAAFRPLRLLVNSEPIGESWFAGWVSVPDDDDAHCVGEEGAMLLWCRIEDCRWHMRDIGLDGRPHLVALHDTSNVLVSPEPQTLH